MRSYKIIIFLFLICSLDIIGQNTIGVTITRDAPSGGLKKITVSYVANGAFVASNGSDDWGTQVITLGWKPSTGLVAANPSTQITGFAANSSYLPFVGAFTGTSSIIAFTLNQIGGSNDGNVYTSFVVNTPTIDKPLSKGSKTEIFSFYIPANLGLKNTAGLFLLSVQPSGPQYNLKPTILNSFYGDGAHSIWNMVKVSIPLPAKLSVFSAEQYSASASKLNWTTSFGQSVDYFDIERSDDGMNWSNIGSVKASENSNSELEYSYIDNNLPLTRSKEQIFYYRLRMTDLDGKFEYSDIRGVNFTRSAEVDIQIYPNPTSDLINVDLSGFDLEAGDIHLGVYDNSGRKLMAKKIIGNGIELLDVSHLPAATYQVAVEQGNIHHRQTIIKID